MLSGIIPILFVPFHENGEIAEDDLRHVVRFELEGGCDAIGINGFASEAYKMTDAERLRCAEIVAAEVAGAVPLVIGIAPGSLEAGIQLTKTYARLNPTALMTLPPATMQNTEAALVEFYVTLGRESKVPIMVQQSPHYAGYSGTLLSVESLEAIAKGSDNVCFFKIEGAGSAQRISDLKRLVSDRVRLFGGIGGIALQDELRAGAGGLLPGVGFNEVFVRVWKAWRAGDPHTAHTILEEAQPLIEAVSGKGHEYSLYARKYLMKRAGIIQNTYVRRPTVNVDPAELEQIGTLADSMGLRISRGQ